MLKDRAPEGGSQGIAVSHRLPAFGGQRPRSLRLSGLAGVIADL